MPADVDFSAPAGQSIVGPALILREGTEDQAGEGIDLVDQIVACPRHEKYVGVRQAAKAAAEIDAGVEPVDIQGLDNGSSGGVEGDDVVFAGAVVRDVDSPVERGEPIAETVFRQGVTLDYRAGAGIQLVKRVGIKGTAEEPEAGAVEGQPVVDPEVYGRGQLIENRAGGRVDFEDASACGRSKQPPGAARDLVIEVGQEGIGAVQAVVSRVGADGRRGEHFVGEAAIIAGIVNSGDSHCLRHGPVGGREGQACRRDNAFGRIAGNQRDRHIVRGLRAESDGERSRPARLGGRQSKPGVHFDARLDDPTGESLHAE